jgi:predicted nucleic acid-binding protein
MSDKPLAAAFIDTNIWLYAFIESGQSEKSHLAREVIYKCQPMLSLQVINEVCINLIRKANFTEDQIRQLITSFYEKYQVIDLDQEILLAASDLRQRYSLSFWDSLIIGCALQAGVEIIYSEDLQHQQLINGSLRIINPFAE